MAANLRIKFESGMIVILLTAPRLVKPLAHKLIRQLLCHRLPHAHDPISEHFADGLVLPKPTHLDHKRHRYLQQEAFLCLEGEILHHAHRSILRFLFALPQATKATF